MGELCDSNTTLRELSGEVVSADPVVSFLYELMRDHLPTGVVQKIINNSVHDGETKYTNGYLAEYSKYLANRLRRGDNS